MKKNKKRIVISIVTMMAMCMSLTGCQESADNKKRQSVQVEVKTPVNGDLILTGDFIGNVTPMENVYTMSMVSGRVTNVNVSVGSKVKEDDILCKIDDSSAKIEANAAQANFDTAKTSADKTKESIDSGEKIIETETNDLQNSLDSLSNSKNQVESKITKEKSSLANLKKQKEENVKEINKLTNQYNIASDYYDAQAKKDSDLDTEGETTKTLTEKEMLNLEQEVKKQGLEPKDIDEEYLDNMLVELTMLEDEQLEIEAKILKTETKISVLESQKTVLQQSYVSTKSSLKAAESVTDSLIDSTKTSSDASINAQINAANSAVNAANYQLDLYNIKAPISGVVEEVNVSKNNMVASGSAVCVISNKESMMVTFYVSEAVRNTFLVGDILKIIHNDVEYSAKIAEIGQSVDTKTRLFEIKGKIDMSDKKEGLLTGTSVKITANTYKENNALLLPYDSVYYDDKGSYLYIADGKKAKKVYVETGLYDEKTITILSGITKKDSVITSWSPLLSDGAPIEII